MLNINEHANILKSHQWKQAQQNNENVFQTPRSDLFWEQKLDSSASIVISICLVTVLWHENIDSNL